eukprot:comp22321_c0_seq1/m.33167 comp22321_c0_seq1/g.33167  ORF comp22321_c0_seq1/g.33167 comp22321_c0_seq1/m.33167 type:complete len:276 (-) comp22321_c0_seq1:357-1184(-)
MWGPTLLGGRTAYRAAALGAAFGSSLLLVKARQTAHTEAVPQPADDGNRNPSELGERQLWPIDWDENWDRRKPHDPNLPKGPPVVRHIYLVRHGQYMEEEGGKDTLTALGRSQAEAVGKRLAGMNVTFASLTHSTMNRAKETAELMTKSLPRVKVSSCELSEEGFPIAPVPPSMVTDISDSEVHQDGARIEAAFRKHFYRPPANQKESSHEIIVCHGNVIRYFVCRALQVPPEVWLRFGIFHCSVTRIDIFANGRVSLRYFGDVGHLAGEQITVV